MAKKVFRSDKKKKSVFVAYLFQVVSKIYAASERRSVHKVYGIDQWTPNKWVRHCHENGGPSPS